MEPPEDVRQEVSHQEIIDQLRQFPTFKTLYHSDVYRKNQRVLSRLLGVPQPCLLNGVKPRIRDFIRVVQWNVEKGKCFEGLVETFSTHPILQYADLIFLNEVDYGMARSGNRHVARQLGICLNMHVAFAPAHLELTKGIGDDLDAPEENQASLQGNALLSRYPLDQLRIIDLPTQFEPYEFEEKRFGRRVALAAEVTIKQQKFAAVGTHLEVRTTPRGRAKQMAVLMENLSQSYDDSSIVLAGDFNTATFPRGTRWRTFRSLFKLLVAKPSQLKENLVHPDRHRVEPLFEVLKQYGFSIEEFNSREATQCTPLVELEENDHLPALLKKWVMHRLSQYNYQLEFKLDWLVGRSIKALSANQVTDFQTGLASVRPQAIRGLSYEGRKISDHDPIVADIQLVPPQTGTD